MNFLSAFSILTGEMITKHREKLMGLAIVLIVCYHIVPKDLRISFLLPFQMGCIGVDIFLLVSGFGLYRSLSKNNCILRFYLKRYVRTWIPFILSTGLMCVLFHRSLLSFLYEATTLNYFIGRGFWLWYMPCIFMLYLIYPLYHRYCVSHSWSLVIVYIISFICTVLFLSSNLENLRFQYILCTTRIPVFFIGAHVGYYYYSYSKTEWIEEQKNINILYIVPLVVSSCLCLLWFYGHNISIYAVYLYSLGPFSICICRCCLKIFKFRFLNAIYSSLGAMSLEIYLIHQQPLQVLTKLKWGGYPWIIPCILIVFVLAYVFHVFNVFIINSINKK